jgi:predicted nucleic acid-binding protein
MAYWDTSCLVKLYAPEADSADLKAHVVSGVTVVTSEIDAIHLSTALVSAETQVVATDLRLRDAAMRMGLGVYPPP